MPATDENYDEVTAPLWAYLDALTPNLWREGRAYPATGTAMFPLIADGELDLSISFSPALSDDERAAFDALDLGIATLTPAELGRVQAEPHPSWMTRIADDWADRYGTGQ